MYPILPNEDPDDYSKRVNGLILRKRKGAEKKCAKCGAMWKIEFVSDDSVSRCRPCRSAATKEYKRRKKAGEFKMQKCRTCLKPTGDHRANIRYCPEHNTMGRWVKMREQNVINSIKVPTEEEICLQIANECLTKARAFLNNAARASHPLPPEASTRPSTSPP